MPRAPIAGHATEAGTARAAARLGVHGTATLGKTGLTVSRLGFGCYRVDDETTEHAESMRRALRGGVNLIDTSTNYTDGGSERCVGAVLEELVAAGELQRDEIVVVSKIGYVQGCNLHLAMAREAEGRSFADMIKYTDGCWHCVHPEFLADQLDRSLQRLRLGTLDVCLLHNPEYFFSDAAHRGAKASDVQTLRDEFYRRLAGAFAYFETQVAAGRIRAYGVSSNTVTAPADGLETTALDRMLQAAQSAGGKNHHFRVLQLPMNLLETGALFENSHGGRTVLDCAIERGVGVLVNRPLNAIVSGRLVRFAGPLDRQAGPLLAPTLPAELHGETLSRKALHVLTSVPGVSCILLGMRRTAWVDDALPVLGWPRLAAEAVPAAFAPFAKAGRG